MKGTTILKGEEEERNLNDILNYQSLNSAIPISYGLCSPKDQRHPPIKHKF